MDVDLTKEADALICLMYKEYRQRRKSGQDRESARRFVSDYTIHETIVPKWNRADVVDLCRELSRNGLLDCSYAESHAYYVSLSDKGIHYLDDRFKRGADSVMEYIGKIRGLLPF